LTVDEAEKIIHKALKEIDESLSLFFKKDVENAKLKVWNASSEVEYLLFMLKIFMENKILNNNIENQKEKNLTMVEYIVKAQELLQKALEGCREKNLEKVYRKVFEARSYLTALQEKIERGKI